MSQSTRGRQSRVEPSGSTTRGWSDHSSDEHDEPTHRDGMPPVLSPGVRVVIEGGKYDGKYGVISKLTPQMAHLNLDGHDGTITLHQSSLIPVRSSGSSQSEVTPQKAKKAGNKQDTIYATSNRSSQALQGSPNVDYGTPMYRSPSADYDSPPNSPVPVRGKASARSLFDCEDSQPRTSRDDHYQYGQSRLPTKPSYEVGTKVTASAKKLEATSEVEEIQTKFDEIAFRRNFTTEENQKIDLQYEENDPYTGKSRQHLKGLKEAQVDHIIEIQMIDLAWTKAKSSIKGVVTRNQIDIIRKVVNDPDINLNVTTQKINSAKKDPIKAWISIYKRKATSKDKPLPSLRDIVLEGYSERFRDGEFRRIESSMAKAFDGIKKELLSKHLNTREKEIITVFLIELEDIIVQMQIC